jgi:hypothetical protein
MSAQPSLHTTRVLHMDDGHDNARHEAATKLCCRTPLDDSSRLWSFHQILQRPTRVDYAF